MTDFDNPAKAAITMMAILSSIRNGSAVSTADILLRAAQMGLDLPSKTSTEQAKRYLQDGRSNLGQSWCAWHDQVQPLQRALAADVAGGVSPGDAAGRMIAKLKTSAARTNA